MRKLVTVALAAAISLCAFAQDDDNERFDNIEESVLSGDLLRLPTRSDVVSVIFLDHIGWGTNVISTKDFNPWQRQSGNFFVNLIGLKVAPASWFDFTLGIDFGVQYFASWEDLFSRDDSGKLTMTKFATKYPGVGLTKSRSSFNNLYFSAPALLEFKWERFTFAAGAEAALNFAGGTTYSFNAGYSHEEGDTNGLEVNLFSWDVMAVISYSKVGVFAKWRPASVQVLKGAPQFSWWTIGGVLGF